jgi:tRNA (guanine26-N2/guanine27-N2)-dimethyltransferase
VQEFNRDISIATIREYSKIINEERAAKGKELRKITILEALAATGLRTVRYLKEIDSIEKMVSNDWDPAAVELMKKNISYNGL